MASTKFPAKFRVTLKDGHPHPLGFANVYEPHTAAYLKRAATQNNWAYGNWEDQNGVFFAETRRWVEKPNGQGHDLVIDKSQVESKLQPIIIDNVPSSGFRVETSVSRMSTSNKLWRILDPRGFLLEISTDNMEEIIAGGVIDRGEIVGQCQWRTSKILERV